jgi:hypothetical protein
MMISTQTRDHEHLKLLSLFHYILGGLVGAVSLFPLLHVGIGVSMLLLPESLPQEDGELPPEFLGWLFIVVGSVIVLVGLALALCLIVSGRYLSKHKAYWFSFVVACLECINMPLGTILGVFTLVVLCRPSVKELYGVAPPSQSSV